MSPSRVLKLLTLAATFCLVPQLPGQSQSAPKGQDPNHGDRTRSSQSDATQGSSSSTNTSALKEADRKFLQRAAAGNQMEVEVSQMAVEKASNPDVKAFAQKLVDDHTNALQQITQLAESKGVQMKEKGEKKAGNRLNSLSGQEFDRAFMTMQVRHHQKDVSEFERQSKSNGDPEVRALAEKLLPTLREHLERARTVSSEVASNNGGQSVSRGGNASDQPESSDGRKK